MAGSAVLASELTQFILFANTFEGNGPVVTFWENFISPYVKYFALYKKTLTMSLPIS